MTDPVEPKEELPKEPTDDVTALKQKLSDLESKFEFAKSESIKNATKYKNLRDEREQEKVKNLEDSGKWQELAEKRGNEIASLTKANEGLKDSMLNKELKNLCLKHAPDAHDVEDLLAQKSLKAAIKIDKETNEIKGVDEFVKGLRETKPFMFNTTKVPKETTKVPKFQTPTDLESQIRSAKTQKELNKILGANGLEVI